MDRYNLGLASRIMARRRRRTIRTLELAGYDAARMERR
jgi:hypothetical protein